MKILVTGSTGFIGSILVKNISKAHQVVALSSKENFKRKADNIDYHQYDLNKPVEHIQGLFDSVSVVVHLASKVHDLSSEQDLNEYLKINVGGTKKVLQAANSSNVKRFIYLSSVKVHGEETILHTAYKETDNLNPSDAYSISKLQCEELVQSYCQDNDMEYVIIRPPLVYGEGVKANFLKLMEVADKPLPFSLVNNKRSMIYVENLCNAISMCAEHELASNQIFLVKDYSLSTPELIRLLANKMSKRCLLFPCPVTVLNFVSKLLGKRKIIERLVGSLEVDDSKIRGTLNWHPPVSLDNAILNTVTWHKKNRI